MRHLVPTLAAVALLGMSACTTRDPPGTEATRALDRAAGTDTSGAYPSQRDGTRENPPGTAVGRAFDRTTGTDVSGAYPSQADGGVTNPPGTAASRAADRVRNRPARSY